MSKSPVLRVTAIVLAAAVLSFMATPVTGALMSIVTPAGTKVGLAFLDQVDTGKTKSGDIVHFRVDANVVVKGHIVINKGTALTGTVNAVGHPFPQNAGFANIGSLSVPAVDKKVVSLNDVRISAPMFGGDIRIRPGTHTETTTKQDVTIAAK
ncbi:MAG TPA: hypothetical protein VFW01_06260 [bacterium]|nr:hypothetical protein [bacterium]